eukprot:268209-Amorphochlora_amoeboformis.AAC.1
MARLCHAAVLTTALIACNQARQYRWEMRDSELSMPMGKVCGRGVASRGVGGNESIGRMRGGEGLQPPQGLWVHLSYVHPSTKLSELTHTFEDAGCPIQML